MAQSTIVIGIGNEFRGDDAAGLLVARRSQSAKSDHCRIIEHDGEGVDLIHAWEGYDRVIVVDAVLSDNPAGTIHRIRIGKDTLNLTQFRCSSHQFALAEALRLASTLDLLPPSMIVFGITGDVFAFGSHLSPCVGEAIDRTTQLVLQELKSPTETAGPLAAR